MASRSPDRIAQAYARDNGYRQGDDYAPSDLGADFTDHRGHETARYIGVNAGWLRFRCGCGATVFMEPS